jgi:hypothetical protein
MSILMHHDAVTGTSPTKTMNDYEAMITSINEDLQSKFEDTFKEEILGPVSAENEILKGGYKMLQLFNPSPYERTEVFNFSVGENKLIHLIDSMFKDFEHAHLMENLQSNSQEFLVYFKPTLMPLSITNFFYLEIENPSNCEFL